MYSSTDEGRHRAARRIAPERNCAPKSSAPQSPDRFATTPHPPASTRSPSPAGRRIRRTLLTEKRRCAAPAQHGRREIRRRGRRLSRSRARSTHSRKRSRANLREVQSALRTVRVPDTEGHHRRRSRTRHSPAARTSVRRDLGPNPPSFARPSGRSPRSRRARLFNVPEERYYSTD